MPLGLLYIAAYLRQLGHEVDLLDYHARPFDPAEFCRQVEASAPRLVGLNISTPNREAAYRLAQLAKQATSTVVIVGGPHATCAPQDILHACPAVDGVVVGEGERVTARILEALPHPRGFPGFLLRSVGSSKDFGLAPRIRDLDALPPPAYDLIDLDRYLGVERQLYVASSRGCRYDCVFCCSRTLLGKSVVFRAATAVARDLEDLAARYGVRSFYFYDDNMLIWPDLQNFCKLASSLGVTWSGQAAMVDFDASLVPDLARSGCDRLSFGFESGSKHMQKYIGKVIRPEVFDKVAALARSGIAPRGYFIIGFPDEELDDVAETAHLIVRLRAAGLADLAVFPARPYPGTRLYQDCLRLFGAEKAAQILEYRYIDDHRTEQDPRIAAKLHRYNTIPAHRITLHFSTDEVRSLIIGLYRIFYNCEAVVGASRADLKAFLLDTVQQRQ